MNELKMNQELEEIKKAVQQRKRTRKIVILSIAHAYEHPGARNNELNIDEYQISVVLSTMVANLLNLKNICKALVIDFSYLDSYYNSLRSKVQYINSINPKLALEIHLNSFSDPKARGFETLYKSNTGKLYAEKIHKKIKFLMSDITIDRGLVRRDNLFFLNATICPALILEPLFLSNKAEAIKLRDGLFLNHLANSIASGIKDCFSVQFNEEDV